MSNGDRTLFGMQAEYASRRSAGRGKRNPSRPGGPMRTPKSKTRVAITPVAKDTEAAESESVSEILRSTREAEEAHRARLEARIAELERELKEARAVAAAATAIPATATDLSFVELQATLEAQQLEQQNREALDLFLVEAEMRADDEARRKELLEAPSLIPTLLEPSAVAAPAPPAEVDAPAAATDTSDLREKLESATVAMEAAEARAAHNAAQVKRLTEELMAARQEQMQTAARLRDLEDRLSKAEARSGVVEHFVESPQPEVAPKPDHSMPLPLADDTAVESEAFPDQAVPESESTGALEELSVAEPEPVETQGLVDATDTLDTEEPAALSDALLETAAGEEADSATGIEIEDFASALDTPAPETGSGQVSISETVAEAELLEQPAEETEAKSPIDALADVLNEWDEKPAKKTEDSALGESVETEPAAEPDIADALAAWSRGELAKDALPALDEIVPERPKAEAVEGTEELHSIEGTSIEDALANFGGKAVDSSDDDFETMLDDTIDTEALDTTPPVDDVFGPATESPVIEDDDPFAEVGSGLSESNLDDREANDGENTTETESIEPLASEDSEDEDPFATPDVDDIPAPEETAAVTALDDDDPFGEPGTAHAEPEEEDVVSESPDEDDPFGITEVEEPAPEPVMTEETFVAPAAKVEVVEEDEEEDAEDFIPDDAPADDHATPIAARARDNATQMNENLQQWSGLQGGATRRKKKALRPDQTPIATSAESETAETGGGKREEGKKAMVDALLKFMGQR